LDALKRCGAAHFIYRDEPIDIAARTLLDLFYEGRRAETRYACRVDGTIRVGEDDYALTARNISREGCEVEVPKDALGALGIGEWVHLSLRHQGWEVQTQAVVRHVTPSRKVLRQFLCVGLTFEFVQEDMRSAVAWLVNEYRKQGELIYSD
jgi:hypothetical protein